MGPSTNGTQFARDRQRPGGIDRCALAKTRGVRSWAVIIARDAFIIILFDMIVKSRKHNHEAISRVELGRA
jgi:hypothetical protein